MIQRRTLLGATAVAPLATLTGCASQNLAGYASEKPVLDLTQYFNGTVDAHGIFQGRSGQIVRRFTVVMECSWKATRACWTKPSPIPTAPPQRRIWRLTKHADGHYTGTPTTWWAQPGARRRAMPFAGATRWRCRWMAKVYHVDFDDWMYLIDERVMLNRATMSKFGVRLGEITLSFTKRT